MIYCLNCIQRDQNATYNLGLRIKLTSGHYLNCPAMSYDTYRQLIGHWKTFASFHKHYRAQNSPLSPTRVHFHLFRQIFKISPFAAIRQNLQYFDMQFGNPLFWYFCLSKMQNLRFFLAHLSINITNMCPARDCGGVRCPVIGCPFSGLLLSRIWQELSCYGLAIHYEMKSREIVNESGKIKAERQT